MRTDAYQSLNSTLAELEDPRNNVEDMMNRHGFGNEIIADIGRMYLLDGLRDVALEVVDELRNAARAWTTRTGDGTSIVCFNVGNLDWIMTRRSKTPAYFFGRMLHEAIHVLVDRYVTPDDIPRNYGGHDSAWNLIAVSVEADAKEKFDDAIDLNRAGSVIYEDDYCNGVSITQEELTICFGDRFDFDETTGRLRDREQP